MKNVPLYCFSLILGIMFVLRAAPQSSVSQYGITWTFDHAYETGRYRGADRPHYRPDAGIRPGTGSLFR